MIGDRERGGAESCHTDMASTCIRRFFEARRELLVFIACAYFLRQRMIVLLLAWITGLRFTRRSEFVSTSHLRISLAFIIIYLFVDLCLCPALVALMWEKWEKDHGQQ